MPKDHGLVGLGLMLQLWASVEAIVQIAAVMIVIRMPTRGLGQFLLLLVVGLARAAANYVAGMEARSGGLALASRVRGMLYAALAYVAVFLFLVRDGKWGFELWVWVLGALLWPLVLVVLLQTPAWRERLRQVRDGELELTDDNHGVEVAGAMMIGLGAIAVIAGVFSLLAVMGKDTVGGMLGLGDGPMVPAALFALVLRGGFHAWAGLAAVRGAQPERFAALVRRYVQVHWITALVIVAPLAVAITDNAPMAGTALVTVGALLSAWPLLLRSHARRVERLVIVEETATFGPAPDGGLVSVGWLCLAVACGSLPSVVITLMDGRGLASTGLGTLPSPEWFTSGGLPLAVSVAGLAVTLWAAVELLGATARARIAALAFAAVTGGSAIWANAQTLSGRFAADAQMLVRTDALLSRASLLLSIIVPVIVVYLALRPTSAAAPSDDDTV